MNQNNNQVGGIVVPPHIARDEEAMQEAASTMLQNAWDKGYSDIVTALQFLLKNSQRKIEVAAGLLASHVTAKGLNPEDKSAAVRDAFSFADEFLEAAEKIVRSAQDEAAKIAAEGRPGDDEQLERFDQDQAEEAPVDA